MLSARISAVNIVQRERKPKVLSVWNELFTTSYASEKSMANVSSTIGCVSVFKYHSSSLYIQLNVQCFIQNWKSITFAHISRDISIIAVFVFRWILVL
jgi:hypothetical protein